MVPFTPRLIPAVLPNLAHHAPDIQSAAIKTNQLLFTTIQNLPPPSASQGQPAAVPGRSLSLITASPGRSGIPIPTNNATTNIGISNSPQSSSPTMPRLPAMADAADGTAAPYPNKLRSIVEQPSGLSSKSSVDKEGAATSYEQTSSRPSSPPLDSDRRATTLVTNEESEPFDYHATVSALTIRFLSEHEETRVAALKWLIMLHQKVPNKVDTSTVKDPSSRHV